MLFFGHLKTSMNHSEFVSAMAGIGILGGIHMFSWLVVFQFRRNLMEEQRLLSRYVASAPSPPSGTFQTAYSFTYFRVAHFKKAKRATRKQVKE